MVLRNREGTKARISDRTYSILLMSPVIIIFLVVACYPLLQTIITSFFTDRPAEPWLGHDFVGFKNYKTILTDEVFWKSIWNTLYFSVVSVTLELVIGFAVALLLNRHFRGKGFVRAAVMLPWAIPTVIAANAFMFMYNDVYGVFNDLLMKIGLIDQPIAWLGNSATAMPAVIVADVWKCFPFITIILLANLQSIPAELYESARIDGAGKTKAFLHITLPFMKSAICMALLLRTIDAIRVFDMITVLTEGGPSDSTNVLMTNIYRYTFRYMSFDVGAAASVVSFLIILGISLVFVIGISRKSSIE